VGKDPSTVAYWVTKYGLSSRHAERHAARGGLDRERLAALVAAGWSIRAIAAELDASYATVQHWLGKYGLKTARAERLAASSLARSDDDLPRFLATCHKHGMTLFTHRGDGGTRCLQCRSEAVVLRRRRVKAALVEAAGGGCELCGYDRSSVALQFHHVDPEHKSFGIAEFGVARSLEGALEEARKCVLLCANCHAEVEAGLATLPPTPVDNPG
jgi:Homeodomain-like domain-containing protein